MPKKVLECNKIWKKIGHHVIVNDLSLKLYEGDILGFIGPNGAGKTTAIKLMLGLQFANGGTVKIMDYDVKKEFSKAISYVGAIIENPDLYMYLSGYENLRLSARIFNVSDKRIQEVVKIVGLENKINEKVKKYSLGMRQRLGIAQAILHQPKVLILDEPMNGLDPIGVQELKSLLKKLSQKEKMGILISSHILSELESICNRVCILSKGKVLEDTNIQRIREITGNHTYILEVSSINLDNILYHYEVIDANHIRLIATKESITNILKTLLLNDVFIFELKKELVTLEEIFLKVMMESKNA